MAQRRMLVKKGIGPAGLTASEVALEARNIINKLNNKRD